MQLISNLYLYADFLSYEKIMDIYEVTVNSILNLSQ